MRLTLSGDLGDSIVSLAVARTLGISQLNVIHHKSLKTNFLLRAHLVIPLMMAQPYISDVEVDGIRGGLDVSGMRRFHDRSDTLLKMQVKELVATTGEDIPYDSSPWLTVDARPNNGRIAIARSARYQNPRFPWSEIVKAYNSSLFFLGTPKEHADFCQSHGYVEYRPTQDLLEAAKEIQGADFFIGNQSSPNAIAQGLGKRSVLEVSEHVCDCIYPRENISYVTNKPFTIEGRIFTPYNIPVNPSTARLWETAFINAGVKL